MQYRFTHTTRWAGALLGLLLATVPASAQHTEPQKPDRQQSEPSPKLASNEELATLRHEISQLREDIKRLSAQLGHAEKLKSLSEYLSGSIGTGRAF